MRNYPLRLHLREDEHTTWCGRRKTNLLEQKANGVERWLNASHTIETTDRPADVRCEKCLRWAG